MLISRIVTTPEQLTELIWFGLISVLRPLKTFLVILGVVCYPNNTVPGQAS